MLGRVRQNGDHRNRVHLLFDGKTVSVTKKYIITNHLTIIGMILMIIRISLPKTK